MAEGRKSTIRFLFNPPLRLAFFEADITSVAGLIVYDELDDALKTTGSAGQGLQDSGSRKKRHHLQEEQQKQSDHFSLAVDPTVRQIEQMRALEHTSVSKSQVRYSNINVPTVKKNHVTLTQLSEEWIDCLLDTRKSQRVVLYVDGSVSGDSWQREGSSCNRYFCCAYCHPPFNSRLNIPHFRDINLARLFRHDDAFAKT